MMALSFALAGCMASDRAAGLGEGDDDGGDDAYRLVWADPASLRLGYGESVRATVRYEDALGRPVSDVVDFALLGQAGDASLETLQMQSRSEDGTADTVLHASSVAASFRLRASAPLAEDVFLDVSVSDAGFGTLAIDVSYSGTHEIEWRNAQVFTSASCGSLDPFALPPSDRSIPMGQKDTQVTFPDLAVGPHYAVAITGHAGDAVVLFGCVADLDVRDDLTTTGSVELHDLEPSPLGEFEVRSELDLADAVEGRPAAWLDATSQVIAADGGAAEWLLARIADYVAAQFDEDAGSGFAADAAAALSELQADLGSESRDPAILLSDLAADLEDSLGTPVLYSRFTIDPGEAESFQALHDLDRIEVLGEAIGLEVDSSLSLPDLSIVSQGTASVDASTGSVVIGEHELAFPMGSLAAAIAETLLPGASQSTDLPDLVAAKFDCPAVAATLQAYGADGTCDVACLEAACREASIQLASSIGDSLRAGDEELERLVIDGRAEMQDRTGDLRAEQLTAGQWLGQISPSESPIGGSFLATRVEEVY